MYTDTADEAIKLAYATALGVEKDQLFNFFSIPGKFKFEQLKTLIDFLSPENAVISVGASFDQWDTEPFAKYNVTDGRGSLPENKSAVNGTRRVL